MTLVSEVRVYMMNKLAKFEVLSKSVRNVELQLSNGTDANLESNGSAFAFLLKD